MKAIRERTDEDRLFGFAAELRATTDMFAAPSEIFVFLDENKSNINDCLFVPATPPMPGNNPAAAVWTDMPGAYHLQSAVLSFADGHEESHRWKERSIIESFDYGLFPAAADSPWIFQHLSEPR